MGSVKRLCLFMLASLLMAGGASAREQDRGYVRNIELLVPPGKDFYSAYDRVRHDEGLELGEALVDRHVQTLGDLGWVKAVEVDVRTTRLEDRYDLVYRLIPRDTLQEIRIEGNHSLSELELEGVLTSRKGETFNLRQALDDAHQINMAYQEAGYAFSGVLASENVRFDDGVLTFKVAESRLSDPDRIQLEKALGHSLGTGTLTRKALSDVLAKGDLRGLFEIGELELDLDRSSGELRLGGQVEYERAVRAQAGD